VTSDELRRRVAELGEQRSQAKQTLAEADAELRQLLVLGWRERLLTVVEMGSVLGRRSPRGGGRCSAAGARLWCARCNLGP
jgi:hypothetical protein